MMNVLKKLLSGYSERPLWQRRTVFGIAGALGGFAYYYFVGCASGACPISSNPYISAAYGSLMGLLVPVEKKKAENAPEIKSL